MASCISNGRCEKKIAVSMAKKYMTHMNPHVLQFKANSARYFVLDVKNTKLINILME